MLSLANCSGGSIRKFIYDAFISFLLLRLISALRRGLKLMIGDYFPAKAELLM